MPPSGGGEQLDPGHEPSNTGDHDYIHIIADQEAAYYEYKKTLPYKTFVKVLN